MGPKCAKIPCLETHPPKSCKSIDGEDIDGSYRHVILAHGLNELSPREDREAPEGSLHTPLGEALIYHGWASPRSS